MSWGWFFVNTIGTMPPQYYATARAIGTTAHMPEKSPSGPTCCKYIYSYSVYTTNPGVSGMLIFVTDELQVAEV
jgi:hypothetical protein